MKLIGISNKEQSTNILRAWWNRPKCIWALRNKYPNKIERIKELSLRAMNRKNIALEADVYFQLGNTEPININLND